MSAPSPIAVVGVAFRLPGGVTDLESLETLLNHGHSGYVPIPADRWNRDGFHGRQQNARGGIPSKSGYFLQEDISNFDARLFQFSRQEAATLDPKQRLLLQTTYEAFENAGIPLEEARGSNTSVYVSTFTYDYERIGFRDTQVLSGFHTTSVGPAILANRLSHFFDLRGPSFTLDTGCSGGLVALHQACQSLRSGESNMAVVGGAQLLLDPDQSVNMAAIGMLNPDGHCYAFDARGKGYGRGEGVATLILKRLDDALANSDPVHTIIVNSGLNQDGKSDGSIMSPSDDAQRNLMRSVYADVGLDPVDTPYVEAHGTGTQVGDTNEISSIYQVFSEEKQRNHNIVVGSVKSNIGHLEAVAGLAGLLKAIVVLKSGLVPPQLHFSTPKESLKLAQRGIVIPTSLLDLPPGPRRASVNSFGYGGTNAHVIIESSPLHTINRSGLCRDTSFANGVATPRSSEDEDEYHNNTQQLPRISSTSSVEAVEHLLVVSANSEASLKAAASKLSSWAQNRRLSPQSLSNLSYTLLGRRSHLPWRKTIVVHDAAQISSSLTNSRIHRAGPSQAAFIFTGQGAQWAGMGRELWSLPVFRRSVEKSQECLLDLGCDWLLSKELFAAAQESRLGSAQLSQPCTTSLQIALVDLLSSLGLIPTSVIGHSSGEIAAAYAAGALSHKAAIEAAYHRGVYSAVAKHRNSVAGSMMAVGLGEDAVTPYLGRLTNGLVKVACINSPESTTVSGDTKALDELQNLLNTDSIFARRLKVDTAYHSHHMQAIATDYYTSIARLESGPTRTDCVFYSTVTGARKVDDFTADYWVLNLLSKVRFSDGLRLLADSMPSHATGEDKRISLIEIGPTAALAGPTKQTFAGAFKYTYDAALNRGVNARKSLLTLIGRLIEEGHQLNIGAVADLAKDPALSPPRVLSDLPGYAFDESSYWAESRISAAHRNRQFPVNDLCGILDPVCTLHEPRWRHVLNFDALPWLKDHVINGEAVFPASGYVAMVIEAKRQLLNLQSNQKPVEAFVIKDMALLQAITFTEDFTAGVELQLTLSPSKAHMRSEEFRIFSYDSKGKKWYENCHGLLKIEFTVDSDEITLSCEDDLQVHNQTSSLTKVQAEANDIVDAKAFYEALASSGNHYGAPFALLGDFHKGTDLAWTTVSIPDYTELLPGHEMQPHLVHPTLLDAFSHNGAMLAKAPCGGASIVVGTIEEMSISATFAETIAGSNLLLTTSQQPLDSRTVKSSSVVFRQSSQGHVLPVLTALYIYRAYNAVSADDERKTASQQAVYATNYQPDVDFAQLGESSIECTLKTENAHDLTKYLNRILYKNPKAKLLEIESLTDAASWPLLRLLLDDHSETWPKVYDIASSSTQDDEIPETRQKHVTFRSLDILDDLPPESLGIKYDIIACDGIFSKSANIDTSLINAQRLLRDGGRLIVLQVPEDLPYATAARTLRRHSFVPERKFDLSMASEHVGRFIVAAKQNSVAIQNRPSTSLVIVSGCQCASLDAIVESLRTSVDNVNPPITVSETTIESLEVDQRNTYIILDSAKQSLLSDEAAPTFPGLQKLLCAEVNIIWVASQDTDSPMAGATRSMIRGASRVIRRERGSIAPSFKLFEVEDRLTAANAARISQHILTLAQMPSNSEDELQEQEFLYRDDTVMIPRLQIDTKFYARVRSNVADKENISETIYHQHGRPLKLNVETSGSLSGLHFIDDASATDLGAEEIQLSSRAHGINFKDVFIALGQMPATVSMVGEVSGIVTAVGKSMTSRYRIGDHVMGFFAKPYASCPRLDGNLAHVMPRDMSFTDAATIPCVYATAYHCLFHVARMRKGQSVLITAASGGVGQAAIQLALYAGASNIFVTLGSKSKGELITEAYGIPPSHIFSSRNTSFKKAILRMTGGRGVDVVLNSLTGDMLTEAFECVAKLGTFCEIGKSDMYKDNHLGMKTFDRSVTFAAVDLVAVAELQPQLVHEHLDHIVSLFEQHHLRPMVPVTAYTLDRIEEAFRMIAGRKHTGKVVLDCPDGLEVKAVSKPEEPLVLSSNSTYVIAGGLGDLGRKISVLLASRGAGHILLLSRRVVDQALREKLDLVVRPFSCKLHIVQCDITDEASVVNSLRYCQHNGLSVKGIVHCGMVLRDRPFINMTHEEFKAPLGPKVFGTINLQKVFASSSLEFFLMLSSSATVIGNGSQTNYAAANAFQDSFAIANAEDAHTAFVSLSLGAVEGSGAVSAISKTQSTQLKSISITMEDLLKAVEYAISPRAREDKLSHAIMGVSRQGFIDADDVYALSNPMFSHLTAESDDAESSKPAVVDVATQLRNASSAEEAQAIVLEAVVARCAAFLDLPADELPRHQPLSEIGFDSLVSIELKNWLMRTFNAPVQTADISAAPSVVALASTIMQRSKIIDNNVRANNAPASSQPENAPSATAAPTLNSASSMEAVSKPSSESKPTHVGLEHFKCCVVDPPPKVPLFDLSDFLDHYWRTVSPFARNDSERQTLLDAIRDFSSPGSTGVQMYTALTERANDPAHECWLADDDNKSSFLHFRHPLAPWNSFMHTHHEPAKPHSQVERAAILTSVAWEFLKKMEKNEVGNDWLGSRPLCSHYWTWMFNAVRRPGVGCDEMLAFPSSGHAAVLYRGHLFRVELTNGGVAKSVEELQAEYESIRCVDLEDSWAGILTTDFRDPWAENRHKLTDMSEANSEYFQTIEEAVFVICLDQGTPTTGEERVGQGIAGTGFNRWFDKTTQFVVYANGCSAHISDHTMVDGTTPLRLTEYIHDAIISHQTSGSDLSAAHTPQPEPLPLQTDATIDAHISRVRTRYSDTTSAYGYRYIKSSLISSSLATGTTFSSKTCLDFTLQLAARLHFGYNSASWEPISLQHFHRGRPDPRQPVTDNVVAFCEAACDESVSVAEKRRLLRVAAEEWDAQTKRTQEGSGFLRRAEALLGVLVRLTAPKTKTLAPARSYTESQLQNWSWADSLASLVPSDLALPALFANEVFARVYPGNMYQVRNEGEFLDAAGYVMGEDCIWVSNKVREDYVALSVVGEREKVERYEECFYRAAHVVRSIVTATE